MDDDKMKHDLHLNDLGLTSMMSTAYGSLSVNVSSFGMFLALTMVTVSMPLTQPVSPNT